MTALRLLLVGRWRQALAPTLVVAALIGAIGGFALASATAARRVESSYRAFLSEVDAPDLVVRAACNGTTQFFVCTASSEPKPIEAALTDLRALDVVQKARAFDGLLPYLVTANGTPLFATPSDPTGCGPEDRQVEMAAIGVGGATEQAMPFRLEGVLPARGSTGVVLARATAERAGLVIGDTFRLAGYCDAVNQSVHRLGSTIDLVITGLSISPIDIEPPRTGRTTIETAYVDRDIIDVLIARGAETNGELAVWLEPTATEASAAASLAAFDVLIDLGERADQLDDALATDARLLWLLAAVGALGGILVLLPIIDRSIRQTGPRTETLSAIGATRRQIAEQAAAHGAMLAVLGGSAAAILAVPFSALMPRGLAEAIMRDRPLSIDWLVTFAGVGLIGCTLSLIGVIVAWRSSTTRRSRVSARNDQPVRLPRMAPVIQTGVQAAVGTPVGPRRVNLWTTLLPMLLVATVGVASLTYLAGLRHLEKTPALLGWNWDALVSFDPTNPEQIQLLITEIAATEGIDQVTPSVAFPIFFPTAPDTDVALIWPWIFATGPDAITPTMFSGRAPASSHEVAVDHVFAELTGLSVGDEILLARPTLAALIQDQLRLTADELGLDDPVLEEIDDASINAAFVVTGIAVLPLERLDSILQVAFTFAGFADFAPDAKEIADAQAWLPSDLAPEFQAQVNEAMSNVNVDVSAVFVRFSGDESSLVNALASRDGVADVLAPSPAELGSFVGLNLKTTDRVPISLAMTVAGLYVALIVFLLFASVRARRFEFALMRALGMTTGGIRLSAAAQATTTALVSLVVAIPGGVLVGRWAWLQYAHNLNVLPVSAIPWMAIAVVCVATIAIANLAALCLGWPATRRSSAADLRSE